MQIEEPHLPSGFNSRPAKMADVEVAARLINDCNLPITGLDRITATELHNAWTTPGLNMATDTRMVMANNEVAAGLVEYWDIQEPHIQPSLALYLHPDFDPGEIGKFLLDWSERRAQSTLELAPAGEEVNILVAADGRDENKLALLNDCGYSAIRTFWQMLLEMNGQPPQAVRPTGIDLRNFIAGQDERAVHETMEASFADHWRYAPTSFEQWLHWNIEHEDFDPLLWLTATEGDTIAGALIGWPNLEGDDETGFISDLGVRPEWRRRGIGQALLQDAFSTFYHRGIFKVSLTVDTESTTGASRLYQRVGMQPVQRRFVFEKAAGTGLDRKIE